MSGSAAPANPFEAVGAVAVPTTTPETIPGWGPGEKFRYRLIPGTTGIVAEDLDAWKAGRQTAWEKAGKGVPAMAVAQPRAASGISAEGAPKQADSNPFAAVGAIPVATQGAAPSAPGVAATLPPTGPTGALANIGAGTSEAVAGLLGMPVDMVTQILNLVPRGINAVAGTNIPPIERPVGGSESVKQAFGLIGANPENVPIQNEGEGMLRAAGRGAANMALPGGIAKGLATATLPGRVAAPVLEAIGAGAGVPGAAIGAAGGVVGHAAAEAAPPEFKGLADLLGNVAGGGAAALTGAGVSTIGNTGRAAFNRARMPMNLGPREVLVDPSTGQPFLHSETQQPITATPGQMQLAGQGAAGAAGMAPGELAAAIPSAADAALVPGSTPTAGQATGNLGLLGLERRLRTANRTPFTGAEARNAVARVEALRGAGGPEEAGRAAGEFFAEGLRRVRDFEDALEGAHRTTAQRLTEQLGGAPGQVTEQELGAAHRAALEALRKPVRDAASRLYDAVDPDGTLAVGVKSVAETAKRLLGEVNERMGGSLAGEEADVLRAAAGMRPVELFADLRALDSNLSAAQRAIKSSPALGAESRAYARVTALRKAVDEAMQAGAEKAAAKDPAVGNRLAGEAENWLETAGHGKAANETGPGPVGPDSQAGAGARDGGPGLDRGEGAPEGRPGDVAVDSRVAPGAPTLAPNLTAADARALREANAAYADYKDTFRRGAVGDVLRSASGGTGFKMAESAAPKALFRPGPAGAEAADQLIRAAGSPAEALKLLGDYPAMAFRRAAERDGVIDPKLAQRWIDQHRAVLDKFPGTPATDTAPAVPGLRERFADAASATREVERASEAGQQAIKAYQDSAAGHWLSRGGEPVEPQVAMQRLLSSPTAVADAKELMRLARNDQAATDGIKRNLVDYMQNKLTSTAEAGTTGEKEIAGAGYQKFMADPKNAAVVRAVLGDQQAELLRRVAEDIFRASRAVNATKIPGSPGTAADLHSLAEAVAHEPSIVGQVVLGQALGQVLESVMHGAPGIGGAVVGGGLSAASLMVNAMRNAGLRNVDDLLAQAVINPELMRMLVLRTNLADKPQTLNRLLGRIAAIGVTAPEKRD